MMATKSRLQFETGKK